MIAKIILNRISHATDMIYDYLIPENMNITVGMRVIIPFGNGNKTEEGYVVGLAQNSEFSKLKPIIKPVDNFVYFDSNGVELAEFMHNRYFCKYSEAIKCLLPPNVNTKFETYYTLSDTIGDTAKIHINHSAIYENIVELLKENVRMSFEQIVSNIKGKNIVSALNELKKLEVVKETVVAKENVKDAEKAVVRANLEKSVLYSIADSVCVRAPKQAAVLETVCDNDGIHLSELLEICQTTHSTVNSLVKKGYIFIDKEIVRTDIIENFEYAKEKNIVLTDEQNNVINEISSDIENGIQSSYLLHGVTGSGKTQVYLNLVEKCIRSGKNALFLVPEISLTPQMIRQVVTRFGDNVAVLHSSLTIRERYDQWKKIKCGEVNVVVGARSAIFAPFDRIGLIIIDEEHESSYKSELSPKYSTVEIAKFRSKQMNSVLLLASATPSVETYFYSLNGKIKLLELKSRINNVSLPTTEIVDMRQELRSGNTGILSQSLKTAIQENLDKKYKTILFLNRRGYSGFLQCRSCGNVIECPNCNISMTYHRDMSSMVCHYCDYKTSLLHVCPKCGSGHIKYAGEGTQKVEEELNMYFPNAKILRMDADTTSSRNSHERILNEFAKDDSDILIGTQMVTKGLDFEKVTLVGVLAADMSLNLDDFRSDEKTFDLITQVCGRAGRGKYSGKAIIQTYDPENETIRFSKDQDYLSFYEREIEVRRLLTYPPYCEIVNFMFSSESEETAFNSANKFHTMLHNKLVDADKLSYVIAYKVMPAPLHRLNGNYRYRFIMKMTYNKTVYDIIHQVETEYRKGNYFASLSIDVNPYNMN